MKKVIKMGYLAILLIGFSSNVFAGTFNINLTPGSRNSEVKSVQDFLISKGLLTGPSTTYFGNLTKKAVQTFQKQNGLPTTGNWFPMTRQKANTESGEMMRAFSSSTVEVSNAQIGITSNPSITQNKEITLTISNSQGGSVISSENNILCNSNESCKKIFQAGKRITLKSVSSPGYTFKAWSEASCGEKLECSVLLIEDSVVYAKFEVSKPLFKPVGYITSPKHPSEICYIPLGREKCNLKFNWTSNLALNMTIKVDYDEYYLAMEDPNTFPRMQDVDPDEIAKAVAENTSGPIYFSLAQGTHKIEIKSAGQVLDSVVVEVKCDLNYVWDGNKCWEKGSHRLFVFKQEGAIITSNPTVLKCGYRPEMCIAGFSSTTLVTLKATVLPGFTFVSWNGDCSGTESTCTVMMDKDRSIGFKLVGGARAPVAPTINASGTYEGKPVPGCISNWQCAGWGICSNSLQTRYCGDINNCNNPVGKPQTSVSCEIQTWK